jgi:V/A-type H+/Na+-transporting ATPase subunit F
MKFYCVGDETTVRGFRLAGVEGVAAGSAEAVAAALEQVSARPDCGILILTQAAAELVRAKVDAMRLEHGRPLIVEIPGSGGPVPGHRTLRRLVQEAVGISVGGE